MYDEVGTRTRQAWLRTALVVVGVAALVARGVIERDGPAGLIVAAAACAIGFLAVAVVRLRRLGHGESPAIDRRLSAAAMACIGGVVLVSALWALA